MKLFRMECDRNVRLVLPHAATTLPSVTIMNAADPSDSTFCLIAAMPSEDQPSASGEDAVSHEAPGKSAAGRCNAAALKGAIETRRTAASPASKKRTTGY